MKRLLSLGLVVLTALLAAPSPARAADRGSYTNSGYRTDDTRFWVNVPAI